MNKVLKTSLIIGVLGAFAISLFALKTSMTEQKINLGSSEAAITSFSSFSNTPVGTTAVKVLDKDVARAYALFTNDSDTAIYLNFSSASTTLANYAVRLNANGGTYEMGTTFDNLYSGEVWASSTVATKTLLTIVK